MNLKLRDWHEANFKFLKHSPALINNNVFEFDDINLSEYPEININHFILGKYFEELVKCYFNSHPDYKIVLQNKQIIDEAKHTHGEIDLIVNHIKSNQIIHLETSIKFYLNTSDSSSWSSWVGPNSKDNFEIKTNRLYNHQLQLSKSPLIKKVFSPEINDRKCIYKGYFINHYFKKLKNKTPETTILNSAKFYWIHANEIDLLSDQVDFLVSDKTSWIQWGTLISDLKSIDFNQLKHIVSNHFKNSGKQLNVIIRSNITQIMIMHPFWPNDSILH